MFTHIDVSRNVHRAVNTLDGLPMALAVGYRDMARNPVDDPFADHDHRGMRTPGPRNARHHGRIYHPQSLDALDPAILIHDRHRVGIRSHLTGPGHVPG